jgi:hypothetical protein
MKIKVVKSTLAKGVVKSEDYNTMGEVSDGYHTFDELYAHRTALLRALVMCNPDMAWKSRQHEVGGEPMFEGFFIVGLNLAIRKKTHGGGIKKIPITYHVEEKYWNDFDIHELENAPKWDGHTPDDVISRLLEW